MAILGDWLFKKESLGGGDIKMVAMLGAFLARPIALWLGARRLKTAGGLWIVASALYLVWLAAR